MKKEICLTELGNRIKTVRQSKGISQDELARLCGYNSRSSVNKIEAGLNDIPQSKIKAIADALHVSPAWLMGYDDRPAAGVVLSAEEKDVVSKYRKLSPEGKMYIQDQLDFRLGKEAASVKSESGIA